MSNLFLNKVGASICMTALAMVGLGTAANSFFHKEKHEQMGYAIDIPEAGAEGGAAAEEEKGPTDYLALMTAADPAKGEAVALKCKQCHSEEKDGPVIQGPPLYGVVGREIASYPGFKYSAGDNGLEGRAGQHWDYEHLFHFLERPKGYAPDTAMNFVGIRKETDRADLIAFLRTLTDGEPYPMPDPLPVTEEAPAEDAAAPAEGEGEAAPAEAADAPSETPAEAPAE